MYRLGPIQTKVKAKNLDQRTSINFELISEATNIKEKFSLSLPFFARCEWVHFKQGVLYDFTDIKSKWLVNRLSISNVPDYCEGAKDLKGLFKYLCKQYCSNLAVLVAIFLSVKPLW